MDIEQTTARVIAIARDVHGLSAAELAFEVAAHGIGHGHGDVIQDAIYRVAYEQYPQHVDNVSELEPYMERSRELRRKLQPALDRYEARCKARKYVGWSNASSGPIRFAD